MHDIQPFTFPNTAQQVRVVLIDGEPWFVAADVCAVLGYVNGRDALAKHVPAAQRGVSRIATPSGEQAMSTISEPGLYRLIMRSNRPEAEAFQDWVTAEVLPAIRRTGSYSAEPTVDLSKITRRDLAVMLIEAEDARELAEQRAAELEAATAEMAPKANYVDSFVNGGSDATTIRVLANQLQVGEKELRALLVEQKAIYQKLEGRRYSRSQGRMVPEYSWHAYATHRTWFVERDQPEAPRYHNGQMRTTLYVTPVGKVGISKLVRKSA